MRVLPELTSGSQTLTLIEFIKSQTAQRAMEGPRLVTHQMTG